MIRLSDIKMNDIPVVDSVVEISRLLATFLNELSKYTKIQYRHIMSSNHSQNRYLGTKASETTEAAPAPHTALPSPDPVSVPSASCAELEPQP